MTESRVHELLERLGHLIRAEQRRIGAELGLQPIHLQVVSYLSRCNRYSDTPMAVTEYLGPTKGTISQTLLLLERKGLLQRQPDEKDRRRVHLALTDEGRAVAREIASGSLAALPASQAGRLETGLEDLLRRTQKARGSRTFGVCGSCGHLLRERSRYRCGLTGEPLVAAETAKICREHEERKTP